MFFVVDDVTLQSPFEEEKNKKLTEEVKETAKNNNKKIKIKIKENVTAKKKKNNECTVRLILGIVLNIIFYMKLLALCNEE